MNRKNIWRYAGFLALISAALAWAQPFPDNEENRWAYETVAGLMARAGMPDSAVNAFRARKDLTRMEFAMWVNSVMLRLEEQGMAVPMELAEKVDKLSTEFQREFLWLELQEEVRQNRSRLDQLTAAGANRRYEWGGDFSLYAEKLDGRLPVSPQDQESFGPAPQHTKVMLAQQLRIKCRAELTPALGGVLELRNFGYWGVGRYTSGSTDINFSSADPLKIDQAFIHWDRKKLSATIGRKNLCYGLWGLLVDRRYEPINALEITCNLGAEIRMLLASQFSGIDYLAGRAQMGGDRARIGATGFYTLFSRSEQEEGGLRNEQGAGLDIELGGRKVGWKLEYGLYKPERSTNVFQGYVPGLITEWRFSYPVCWKTEFGLGTVAENFLWKSMPLDIMPLEFPKEGENVFRPGTKGFRLAGETKLWQQAVLRTDWMTMVKHNGTFYLNQGLARLELKFHPKIQITIEDSYIYGRDQKYNQAGAMVKIGF